MNLLLIRHGLPDTEHGPRPDPPLAATGRAQGEALAGWLAGEQLAAVYTSPLRRARETARYLAADPIPLDGLAEIGGTGEYMSPEEMKRTGDPRYAALITGDLAIYGEDAAVFRATVTETIDRIVDRHPGETVAVVSHAGVINAYLGVHLGIEKRLIWSALDYASVSRVMANQEGARTIKSLNEVAHFCRQPAKESAPWPVGS